MEAIEETSAATNTTETGVVLAAVAQAGEPDDLAAIEDGAQCEIPTAEIEVKADFNPRRYFCPAAHQTLVESVRRQGVLQPVVVRPKPGGDGFWLVAGERRLRAARDAGLEHLPVVVRLFDERQALEAAVAENLDRDDMSPAEEAHSAQRMLDLCDGDRDEAQRRLGWSRTKLRSRLALLHASAGVLDALAERTIGLGHAELLSGLPKETQEQTLPGVIAKGVTVPDLRAKIASFALELSEARFDTSECAGCPSNSALQASLFDTHIDGGRCQNRECFAAKTTAWLEARREEMRESYPVVWLDIERTPGSYKTLVRADVGATQHAACKQCGSFGALLRSEPGHEGETQDQMCFDLDCHAGKCEAHQRAQAEASASKAKQASPPAQPASGSQAEQGGAAPGKAPAKPTRKAPGGTPSQAAKSPTVAKTPGKVIRAVDALMRRVGAEVVGADAQMARAALLYPVLVDAGFPPSICKAFGITTKLDRAGQIAALYGLAHSRQQALLAALLRHTVAEHTGEHGQAVSELVSAAEQIVASSGTELVGRFQLDEDFLAAHTKSGIEALMAEARDPKGQSFRDYWVARQGGDAGAWPKLFQNKAAELRAAILGSGFDFSAFVPSVVRQRIAARSRKAD